MGARWEVGPVFGAECRSLGRRRAFFAARAALGSTLLIALTGIWFAKLAGRDFGGTVAAQRRALADAGEGFFYALVGLQVAMAMLAAPAVAAGAICSDRARGTLTHLLVTDLSDREIILGKLAARLLPSLALVACAWPVLALASLIGGMDPVALALAVGVTLAVAALGCAAALALSVWASKPHEVLMIVYLGWIGLLLIDPIWNEAARRYGSATPQLVLMANPFYVAMAPYIRPGALTTAHYLAFFGSVLALTAAMAALAIGRFRAVTVAFEAGRRSRSRGPGWLGRLVPGPSLDGNPVLWREWHRNRPSRWSRVIWTGYAAFVSVYGLFGIGDAMIHGVGWEPNAAATAAGVAVMFGFLLLSTTAATSLSEERQRGSLDVLMATPLATREIVWGKWWGGFRTVLLLAIWPTILILATLAAPRQPLPSWARPGMVLPPETPAWARACAGVMMPLVVLIHGAAMTSVGLALATWIRHQGRALAASVGSFVLAGFGWPMLVLCIEHRFIGPGTMEAIAGFSPIIAASAPIDLISFRNGGWAVTLGGQAAWLVVVGALAAGLLGATLATFDRCLGRVAERAGRREIREPAPVPVAAAEAFS